MHTSIYLLFTKIPAFTRWNRSILLSRVHCQHGTSSYGSWPLLSGLHLFPNGPWTSPVRCSPSQHRALVVKEHPVCVTTVSFLGTLVIILISPVLQLDSSARLLLVLDSIAPKGSTHLIPSLHCLSLFPVFSVLRIVVWNVFCCSGWKGKWSSGPSEYS